MYSNYFGIGSCNDIYFFINHINSPIDVCNSAKYDNILYNKLSTYLNYKEIIVIHCYNYQLSIMYISSKPHKFTFAQVSKFIHMKLHNICDKKFFMYDDCKKLIYMATSIPPKINNIFNHIIHKTQCLIKYNKPPRIQMHISCGLYKYN